MKLFAFQPPSGPTHNIDVQLSDTISSTKKKLEAVMPHTNVLKAEKQILIYKGKKMDDDSASLESYGMAQDPSLRKQSITVTDH